MLFFKWKTKASILRGFTNSLRVVFSNSEISSESFLQSSENGLHYKVKCGSTSIFEGIPASEHLGPSLLSILKDGRKIYNGHIGP